MGSRAVLNDNVPHICSHLARVQRTQIENGNPGTASFFFCFTLSWKVKEIWKRRRRKHETNSQKKMKVDKRDRSVKECYLEEFGIVDIDGVAVCVICKTVENATAVSRILGSVAEMRENEQDAASISLISNFYRCLRKNILSNIHQFVCVLTHL